LNICGFIAFHSAFGSATWLFSHVKQHKMSGTASYVLFLKTALNDRSAGHAPDLRNIGW